MHTIGVSKTVGRAIHHAHTFITVALFPNCTNHSRVKLKCPASVQVHNYVMSKIKVKVGPETILN